MNENWLMYLLIIVATISGIVISEAALPLFVIHFEPYGFWSVIHDTSATLFMAIFGIHIAFHWRWIVGAIRKLKFKAELHQLSKLSTIIASNSQQLLLILFINNVFSFLFWFFDYSEGADGIRVNAGTQNGEESKDMLKSWIMYVLPLLKVTVITTVTAHSKGAIIKL